MTKDSAGAPEGARGSQEEGRTPDELHERLDLGYEDGGSGHTVSERLDGRFYPEPTGHPTRIIHGWFYPDPDSEGDEHGGAYVPPSAANGFTPSTLGTVRAGSIKPMAA